jgi:sugar lactone lactonase YvrE
MTYPMARTARLTIAASLLVGTSPLIAQAAVPAEIVIPGERIFPESLTSSADGTVIIGSIATKTIFRAKPGTAQAEAWIAPATDGLQNVLGVLADDRSHTLWACSNSIGPPGLTNPPATLYAFDLRTGTPKGHYPFPTPQALCNDIAIAEDGTAYATDTNNMEVVRLKKGSAELTVWAGQGAFGPKGGVLDGIAVLGSRVLVNTLGTSKLFGVTIKPDGSAGAVVEIKLDRPIERPDGMRRFGREGLLIVEGGAGGRLSRVQLHGDEATVTTVKQGYPDGPVAVTVVGDTAYVLEGQLALFMRRTPDSNAMPKPFHATAVNVGKP